MERRSTSAPRFFVEGTHEVGDVVSLAGDDARKLALVLRARAGDAVEVCDSGGERFSGRVRTAAPSVTVELVERRFFAAEPRIDLTLVQAMPKGAKMDFVVEKATELGVARIVPLITERTLGDPGAARLARWARLARSAAQQSGRATVPQVDAPATVDAFLERVAPSTRLLLPWELADPVPLRETLPPLLDGAAHVAAIIGPEGGFSHGEVARCVTAGATLLSLGARILRTESAGLVLLSAILYAAGEI